MWRMSMPRVRSWNVALAAAGAVALIVEGQVRAKGGLSPGDYVLAVAAAVPLAWGTRAPLLALAGVAAGAILCDAAFDAGWAASGMVIGLPPPNDHKSDSSGLRQENAK